ncbi:MAG: sugar phosphate isomerase/epimerase [Verrucomicrobiales bacterium]|nr:sugar phosphate isomerase/epimerase [Verrucomicrobiales bacterium]
MERRNFFRNSALYAGTALAAARELSFGQGEFSGVIKKGVKFSMVKEPQLSIPDQFKMLKDLGYHGTELRTTDLDRQAIFQKAIAQSDFRVHGIVNSSNPDLETAVKFAADLGANSVLYVAPYDKKRPLMESWNETQSVIRKGLPAAEKHGVKILVENVWAGFLISALDVERFVDEIGHPSFGSYFDVGNNVRWGVPEHWIEILGSRIGKLDIKEWDERLHQKEGLRAGFKSELGDGTINWAAVRKALKAINFEGWATAEVRGGDRMRLLDVSQRMDKILGLV